MYQIKIVVAFFLNGMNFQAPQKVWRGGIFQIFSIILTGLLMMALDLHLVLILSGT